MKKILTKFLALGSIGLLMLPACKKDGAVVTSNGGKPGALTASTTTPTLDKTKLTDTTKVINFTFAAANYGFNAAVTNTLQIDAAGDNWVNPASVTLPTKKYSQGYTTSDFNALLLKLNLPAGVASQVNVRVMNSVSASVTPVYSNVLNLTVTPFNLTSYLYVVGAFQGWNINGQDSIVSVTGNGVYTGVYNFPTGAGNNQFLITPVKGSYNNKYATNEPTTGTSTTVTQNGPNNLIAPATPGWYQVTFNLNTNTISFTAVNHYSVIGDAALGWATTGDDTEMKAVNDGNGTWAATLPLVSTGSFKIRQNDDWTYSWGIPKVSGDAGFGIANTLNDSDNNNIAITASGTYTVSFMIPVTAIGITPSITATYAVK